MLVLLNVKSTVTKRPVGASSSPNVKPYFFEKGGFGPLFFEKKLFIYSKDFKLPGRRPRVSPMSVF